MATAVSDLDGTFLKWGTETPLPGAVEAYQKFVADGNQLIFITKREEFDPEFDMIALKALLKRLFPNSLVLFGYDSPRIMINDHGSFAIDRKKNAPWDAESVRILEEMANSNG